MEENPKFNGSPREIADQQASEIPSNFQEAFSRVVKAGMRVMFSEQTHDMMIEQLSQEGDLADNVGNAIAGLMLLLYQKSNKTMPGEVIIPSGVYLLAEGAEKITPDVMAKAMQVMVDVLMKSFGADPSRVMSAAQKAAQGGYQ
jgi:hypothetical protein